MSLIQYKSAMESEVIDIAQTRLSLSAPFVLSYIYSWTNLAKM